MTKRKMTLEEVNKYLLSKIDTCKKLSKEISLISGCENTSFDYKQKTKLLQEIYDTINYEM